MSLERLPLFERLADCRRILIAGCGGGFDVYVGLPLFLHLREQGKEVRLASLSFADLQRVITTDGYAEVDRNSPGPPSYFPEKWLSEWFWSTRGEEVTSFCVPATSGPGELRRCYVDLVERHGIDAVVLVDGGTDSLMRGDEPGLGTPVEDITSIAAVADLPGVRERLLVCLGFGIDAHHGVCHKHFLEAVADLTTRNAFLGTLQLQRGTPAVDAYVEACRFAAARNPLGPSIVQASICDALEGRYGDHHSTERTRGSTLWINPLMTLYWAFDLDAVAARCLYLDVIRDQPTSLGVALGIETFRQMLGETRGWEPMPV